jgi:hypothetical protein
MMQVADEIVTILTPVIGKGLAQSAVTMQCRKLGVLPEDLSQENIEDFSLHFRKVMVIFAGDQVADEIVLKIRNIKD